jgi:rhodanese-related sulfurtransferase
MPSHSEISCQQLIRLVGLPTAPTIIDVRTPEDFEDDRRLLPASHRRDALAVAAWAKQLAGCSVVVVCQKGLKLSEGVAAWLRHEGVRAETLAGGFAAWRDTGGPLVSTDRLPSRDAEGRMVLVTRARPKIDRVACPWLMRRFVDPQTVLLYVAPSEVEAVAERFGATPYDVDGVFLSHRGERCSFDTMIEEFGLRIPALDRLATIVRAADTGRLGDVPQAAGFLAVSLGLSRMFRDDLEQVEAGMLVYDALYRWCRDAVEETHNWPAGKAAQ